MNRHDQAAPALAYLRYLRDRIVAADPSLDQLRSGLRGVLTAGVSAGLFLLITRRLQLPYKLSLGGIIVPMMSLVAVQDRGRRQQKTTIALVPLVASVALLMGSYAADNVWLSAALFLLTIFAAFEARRIGPRGAALGVIAYLSYFYAMLLQVPAAQAAWQLLFVFPGCAIAYVIHFWVVPEHPGRVLRSEVRAYRARVAALLYELQQWLDKGGRWRQRQLGQHLRALNRQSLALESRLSSFARAEEDVEEMRDRVLRSEIAAETISAIARTTNPGTGRGRSWAQQVAILHAAVVSGRPLAAHAWPDRLTAPGLDPSKEQQWRLAQSARTLTLHAPWLTDLPTLQDEDSSHPAPPATEAPAKSSAGARFGLDETTRRALQACAAALGAIVAGRALSPQHWYWAVISAFVVFTSTATVGQAMSRAWLRVLATVGGVCVGLVLAELVHGQRTLQMTLLFVLVAIGFYTYRRWKNVYATLLTMMLAMFYELLGSYSSNLLVQRLEETVIGAAMAVVSAAVIFPVHMRDESGTKSAQLLRSARELLCKALDEPARPPSRDAVRELDRKLQAMRQSLGTVIATAYPGPKQERRLHLHRAALIVYCSRHFYNLIASHASGLADIQALRDAAHVLADNMEKTARRLDPKQGRQPGDEQVAPLPPVPPAQAKGADGDADRARIASDWLLQANEALCDIQRDSDKQD